jgi:hypothetical protein
VGLGDGIAMVPRDLRSLMNQQRTIQASRPLEERIYIGGEIVAHHLTQNGFHVYTVDQFEDYDIHERAIYENFHALTPDNKPLDGSGGSLNTVMRDE